MNSPHYDTKIKYERVETLQELNFVQFVAVRKFLPHECWRKNYTFLAAKNISFVSLGERQDIDYIKIMDAHR